MKINGYGMQIPPMRGVKLSPDLEKAVSKGATKPADKDAFGEMLMNKINQVDQMQKQADQTVTEFATGKGKNLHEAVLAMEMADTSLRFMVTVRNKALEAYQDIMKMPL